MTTLILTLTTVLFPLTTGGHLTRKLSSSHVTPSSMMGYRDFFRYVHLISIFMPHFPSINTLFILLFFRNHFLNHLFLSIIINIITITTNNNNNTINIRQSSSREEGWLETKMKRNEPWQRKWVVFDDGVLTCADSQQFINNNDNDAVLSYGSGGSGGDTSGFSTETGQGTGTVNKSGVMKIPMDQVISLRTDDQYGDSVIQIVTTEGKLLIRAPSKGETLIRPILIFSYAKTKIHSYKLLIVNSLSSFLLSFSLPSFSLLSLPYYYHHHCHYHYYYRRPRTMVVLFSKISSVGVIQTFITILVTTERTRARSRARWWDGDW